MERGNKSIGIMKSINNPVFSNMEGVTTLANVSPRYDLLSVDVLFEHLSALIPHHGCQEEARVQTNGYSSVQKIMGHNI